MTNPPLINVLWTGGLDSTFRICELSRYKVQVQPYYIVEERISEKKELHAIHAITERLRTSPFSRFILHDVKLIDWNSFNRDPEIQAAWTNLRNKYKLGSQYEYLANFAISNNLILEVGLESSPRSKAYSALHTEGKLIQREIIPGVSEYAIDEQNCSQDIAIIFKNLRFPKVLFEISKLEEITYYEKWGLMDVAKMTWFCHNPVLGLPCGRCNPCKDALNEGFSWRVPIMGRIFGFIRGCKNVAFRTLKHYCLGKK